MTEPPADGGDGIVTEPGIDEDDGSQSSSRFARRRRSATGDESPRDESAQKRVRLPSLTDAALFSGRFLLVVGALAVAIWLASRLRVVIVPVLLSFFLAAVAGPPVAYLKNRGWPALLATWSVLLVFLAAVVGLALIIVPATVSEIPELQDSIAGGAEDVRTWLREGPLDLSSDEIDGWIDDTTSSVRSSSSSIASGVLTGAGVAVELVTGAVLTGIVAFFLVKDGDRFLAFALERVPDGRRTHVRTIAERMWASLRAYMLGVAGVGLVDAVAIGIGLAIIGVPLVLPLSLLTFFGAFFPIVGAFSAGLIAVLVALAAGGLTDALLVLGLVILVQQLEGDLVAPVLLGKAVSVHPLAILLALAAGALIAGIVGAFLAVPILAMTTILIDELEAPVANGASATD